MFKDVSVLSKLKCAALLLLAGGCSDDANAGRSGWFDWSAPAAPTRQSAPVQDGCNLVTPIPIGSDGLESAKILLNDVEFHEPIESVSMARRSSYQIKFFTVLPGQHLGMSISKDDDQFERQTLGFSEVDHTGRLRSHRSRRNSELVYTTVRAGISGDPRHETELKVIVQNQAITRIELNTPIQISDSRELLVDSDRRERICVRKATLFSETPGTGTSLPSDQNGSSAL